MRERRNIKIQLVATDRTDLVCVLCGRFQTEFAVVLPGGSGDEAHTGVHKRCIGKRAATSAEDLP